MRVLDLFCGAGGAAMGLHRAWPEAEIVGVDIKPQPRYPFTFLEQDAMQFPWEMQKWDFIWASPPCQAWTVMQYANRMRKDHPKLITPLRHVLERTGIPYVIENVPGAPIKHPKMLCGLSFGLRVLRHRLFETSFEMLTPEHIAHPRQSKVRGAASKEHLDALGFIGFTTNSNIREFRKAMGVEWMTMAECRQAIPPAYSEYIARQFSAWQAKEQRDGQS
jgi:DNA (cytosine-5)-methyltransferase 1